MAGKPLRYPVVDLSNLSGKYEELDSSKFENFAQEFGQALSTIGFVYVVNHGVDMSKIDRIHQVSKEFFLQPASVKRKYFKPNPAECFHGYAGPGEELLDKTAKNSIELREFFDIWGFQQYDESQFPAEVPGYKAAIDGARGEINNFSKKLLHALEIYLRLEDPSFLLKAHSFMEDPSIRTQSQFRALYYPQLDPSDPEIPSDATRCGEHSDLGTITLFFQDMVGGLEVKRVDDGTWVHADPLKDAILILPAQLLELWTAGIFKATFHRVRIPDDERVRKMARQSFIYFLNPDGDRIVRPIVPCPPGKEEFLKVEPKIAYDFYYNSTENEVARRKMIQEKQGLVSSGSEIKEH